MGMRILMGLVVCLSGLGPLRAQEDLRLLGNLPEIVSETSGLK